MLQKNKNKDLAVLRKITPKPRALEDPEETTTSKVTASKFIGGKWYYLYRDKEFTGPRSLVRSFRKAGLVL